MRQQSERREPTPVPVMRAQLAAYRDGLSDDDLIAVTRLLIVDDAAFADWLDGFNLSRSGTRGFLV